MPKCPKCGSDRVEKDINAAGAAGIGVGIGSGAIGGAAIGSTILPVVGTAIGGLLGALVGAAKGSDIADRRFSYYRCNKCGNEFKP